MSFNGTTATFSTRWSLVRSQPYCRRSGLKVGFAFDNTYQLVTGEIVAVDVHPKGIRINRRDRETEYVKLEETKDLIRGMVVQTLSASAEWHRKVWTGG